MRNFNLNKEAIGNMAKKVGKVTFYTLATILPYVSTKDVVLVMNRDNVIGYDDVISAVMNSSMFASDKIRVMNVVPRDRSADLYGSIIQVVKSSMLSSDKVRAIEIICGK